MARSNARQTKRADRCAWPSARALGRPLAGLWLLLASGAASALTIDQYVREVVESNPLVLEQLHAYRQVAQDEQIALAGWRPRLDLAASTGTRSRKEPETNRDRRTFDTQQADLTLTQNLFDGFNTTNQVAQARARLSSAGFQLVDTADNVALDAVQAYLASLTQYRLVALAGQNVESHERILEKIRELSSRGITRRSDLQQTEGRLARAHAGLIAQQNNLEDALTQLHTLLGRYLSPEELLDPAALDGYQATDLDTLVDAALKTHPAIESARSNIEAARFDYKRAKSTDLPSLDLAVRQSAGRDIDGISGRNDESSVVLNLNYNLYRGGADTAEQRKRASVVQESKTFLDRVRRQVIDNLRLALSADRGLAGQIPYLDRYARRALETVELYREEYLLQQRDLIDVLDAESELNRALQSQSEARYDLMAARYRVLEGVGTLFDALDLGVETDGDDIRLASLRAAGIDSDRFPGDRDGDGVADEQDQCDNSPAGATVAANGCASRPQVEIGIEALDLTFEVVDDLYTTAPGQALVVRPAELITNDRVSARDAPELRAYTQAEHGTVTLDADGNLVYTPKPLFAGEDNFEYTIGDRRGRRATGLVRVTVGAVAGGSAAEGDTAAAVGSAVRLYFEYKKLTFAGSSEAGFDAVVAQLRERPELRVEVRAYTDNVGSARYNRRLSRFRADAVSQMLQARGIDAARITAEGRGENEPIADNTSDEGRARNRRVELIFRRPGGG